MSVARQPPWCLPADSYHACWSSPQESAFVIAAIVRVKINMEARDLAVLKSKGIAKAACRCHARGPRPPSFRPNVNHPIAWRKTSTVVQYNKHTLHLMRLHGTFDYIVLGVGAAGCIIAETLAKRPVLT